MTEITLKFPKGEFTHSDLAEANGKTNQQVWTAYQKAIKDGAIVSAGLRTGKGKPSKLWKVADGQPVPVVTKEVPVEALIPDNIRVEKPAKIVRPDKVIVVPAPLVDKGVAAAAIIAAQEKTVPIVMIEPKQTATAPVETPFTVEMGEVPQTVMPTVVHMINADITPIKETCPICNTPLLSMKTANGYRVWCGVDDWKICRSSENPYGHANTIKNAYEVLCDKFKHVSEMKA